MKSAGSKRCRKYRSSLLAAAGMTAQSCVLDVGGGDSRLVDALTARGLDCLAVLDVSGAALQAHLLDTLKPGGAAIVATFAPDGPNQCSGLPVDSYSPGQLARELGPAFELREARAHVNTTPWGSTQSFQYSRLHRRQ